MVLMMNPSVGLTVFTSSPIIFLTIVVLPALSRPLLKCQPKSRTQGKFAHSIRMRISLSLRRALRKMDSIFFSKAPGTV